MISLLFDVFTPEETASIAAKIACICKMGDCLLLRGDLGAGKTAFARGFIQELLLEPAEVISPTFTLVQTYPARLGNIWHFDLYRLKCSEELSELGMDEALADGITLIEWPEIALDSLPDSTFADALHVSITASNVPDSRRIALTGARALWHERLQQIQ